MLLLILYPLLSASTNCIISFSVGSASGSESDGSQQSEEEDDGVSFMAYLSLQKSLKTVTEQRIKVGLVPALPRPNITFFFFFEEISLHRL